MIFAVNKGGQEYLREYPVDDLSSQPPLFLAWEEYAGPSDAGFCDNRFFFFRDILLRDKLPLVFFEKLGRGGKQQLLAEAFFSPLYKRQTSLLISQEKRFNAFIKQTINSYFTAGTLPFDRGGRQHYDIKIIADLNDPDDFIIVNLLLFVLPEMLRRYSGRFCTRIFLFSPEVETDIVESGDGIDFVYSNLKLFCLVRDSIECRFYVHFIHSEWNRKWKSLDYFLENPAGLSPLLPGDSHKISLLIPFNLPVLNDADLNHYAVALKKLLLVQEYCTRKPKSLNSPRMFFDSYMDNFIWNFLDPERKEFKALFTKTSSFYVMLEKLEDFSGARSEKAIAGFYDLFYLELSLESFAFIELQTLVEFFRERKAFWNRQEILDPKFLDEFKQLSEEFCGCGSNFIRRYFWLVDKYNRVEELLRTFVERLFCKNFYTAEALCSLEKLCSRIENLEQQQAANCHEFSLKLPFDCKILSQKIEAEHVFHFEQYDFAKEFLGNRDSIVKLSADEKSKIKEISENLMLGVYFSEGPFFVSAVKKTWRDNFFLWSLGVSFRIIYSDRLQIFDRQLKDFLAGDGSGWFAYQAYSKGDFSQEYSLVDTRVHSADLYRLETLTDDESELEDGSIFLQSGFFPMEVYIYKEIKGGIPGLMGNSFFFQEFLAKYNTHKVVFFLEELLQDYGFVKKNDDLENFLSLRKLITDLPEEKFVEFFSKVIDSTSIAEKEKHQILVFFNEYLKLSAINRVML